MSDSALILAVDTSSEFGSIAIRRGHETIAERSLHSTDGFGHLIFGAIEETLGQAEVRLEDIDCFAAANGPGSFTGVRVALATAKGLAEALAKPAVGISNLRAMAIFGTGHLRAVVLDARRGQVYGAVYDAQGKIVVPEVVAKWQEWMATVPAGADLIAFAGGPCEVAGVPYTAAIQSLAAPIAQWAQMDGRDSWRDPVGLDANYVRRTDAQMFWTDS